VAQANQLGAKVSSCLVLFCTLQPSNKLGDNSFIIIITISIIIIINATYSAVCPHTQQTKHMLHKLSKRRNL